MQFDLTPEEVRILGCLMEKSIFTPDQYPLTLNSLTKACNQKSSRSPVTSLNEGTVQQVARGLRDKRLIRIEENFKNGLEKFTQTFCNTTFGDLQFEPPQFAVITLLLLRGPQTPGELKSRSGRLHAFSDNNDVVKTLESLIAFKNPLVIQLPRTPGRKDSEYMHLISGPIDVESYTPSTESAKSRASNTASSAKTTELEQRVSILEAEVAELKALIKGAD